MTNSEERRVEAKAWMAWAEEKRKSRSRKESKVDSRQYVVERSIFRFPSWR